MATEVTTKVQQVVSGSVLERLQKREPVSPASNAAIEKPIVRQELPQVNSANQSVSDDSQVNQEQLDDNRIGQLVDDLNSYAQNVRRELHFSVDDDSGHTVIKVIDSESKEIVRQIPPEEVVEMMQFLGGHTGILMRAKA